MKHIFLSYTCLLAIIIVSDTNAQITNRARPAEWDNLIFGGRFIDRFLPMPAVSTLTDDTWGADNVRPRYIKNGIEDAEWSYWGGNAFLGEDNLYHLFVCRWREDSPKGHAEWPNSKVVHATAENSFGPYKVKETIGKGHNPEIFRLKDGKYVIYVINGYYISKTIEGPWEYKQFEFVRRDRRIIEGLSNLTFAQREDGTYLMICRGGGVWFSESGVSSFMQVSNERVYPAVDGRFEDPVVWRTNIQYHMIVNDWYGRIAYYLRSKDGLTWKVEPGEAYSPGIAKYKDGTVVDWFKYERIKVMQDELGRATQAHFAVIDTIKKEDKASDNHSSKHICIPLTVGRQIFVLDQHKTKENTSSMLLKIKAENGFNPHTDIDLNSLRFGASEEVNFGRGYKVVNTEKSGDDLLITFDGNDNGFTDQNFAGKLLGKTSKGDLLFGYARLPWVNYLEPLLSARLPKITGKNNKSKIELEVQNFGQVASEETDIKIETLKNNQFVEIASGIVPILKPFEKAIIKFTHVDLAQMGDEIDIKITIFSDNKMPVELLGEVKLDKK